MQNEKFIKLTKKYQYRESKLKYINKIINLCKQYMKNLLLNIGTTI